MNTYSILVAQDTSLYGTVEIRAKSHERALKLLQNERFKRVAREACYKNGGDCYDLRCCSIKCDDTGEWVADDIQLDDDTGLMYVSPNEKAVLEGLRNGTMKVIAA